MSQIETRLALFRMALAERGRRLTREREITARVAFDMQPPIEPEVIIPELSERYGLPVSLATVYRTLHDLVEFGLLPPGAWQRPE